MVQERIAAMTEAMERKPRLEQIGAGDAPCSGPNDDENSGQVMYESTAWLRGLDPAMNDAVLTTVKQYWAKNEYTISYDESTRVRHGWAAAARDAAGFKVQLLESSTGDLSMQVQSPCVYAERGSASPSG